MRTNKYEARTLLLIVKLSLPQRFGVLYVLLLQGENSGQRVKVKVSEHVSDIRSFVETVLAGRRPVYIGHR